ncbi:MAG: flagellar motor protein PomA [Deltaproteobacteria bacterium]|nr:flagellar motor protein PomA [Deltaproteobacteria bacterium]
MDISTLTGILLGIFCMLVAILLDTSTMSINFENLMLFIDIPSVLIVFGGTMATMFIRFSIKETFAIFGVLKHTLFHTPENPAEVIKEFVQLAQIARKDGLLALERVTVEDPFMSKGINYCVDGAETEQIKAILLQEVKSMKGRHESARKLIKAMEVSAPAFGMIGTLIGLVNMLANMDDPKSIGPAMAVAIITTLYGAVIANLFALPLVDKLDAHSGNEYDLKILMVEGILGINRGENPRMLEEALYSFLSPKEREALKANA